MKFRMVLALVFTVAISSLSAAQENATPQEVFDGMRESFRPEKASDVHARFQFSFSGPEGGDWFIEVKDGDCEIQPGKIEAPDVTFRASDKDWVALSNGKLNGTWAFLSGRLKVQGDRGLARKLGEIFP